MNMDIVPGTVSDICGVIDYADDGEFSWVGQTAKIPDTQEGNWDDDSKIYNENRPPHLRHNGWDKWHSWVIIDPSYPIVFLYSVTMPCIRVINLDCPVLSFLYILLLKLQLCVEVSKSIERVNNTLK